MSFVRVVSSEPCVEPVATKNGEVYERRLIEKYIATSGVDPVTKEPLTVSDLIQLKGTKGVWTPQEGSAKKLN